MPIDPDAKKEIDDLKATIQTLKEDLAAAKKNDNSAKVAELAAALEDAKKDLAALKAAPNPPKPGDKKNDDEPELEDEPYTEAGGFGFFRFPGKRPKAKAGA